MKRKNCGQKSCNWDRNRNCDNYWDFNLSDGY